MAACTCADPSMVANSIKSQTSELKSELEDIHKTIYGRNASRDDHSSTSAGGGGGSGGPGMPAPVRFANWAAPEVSGQSDMNWNNMLGAAQLAIALTNSIIQGKISDLSQDLADAYYSMAKFKWDRFEKNYMPLEKKLLQEVSSVEPYEMDCADDRNRAKNAVNTAYDLVSKFITQKTRKYRICIDPSMSSMLDFRRAVALADTENYNILDDRWFVDYKNDQRWNRRSNVLNLGRNLTANALSYGDVARSIANRVGAQVNDAASALMTSIGYYGARNDTFYPTTFLGSQGGMNPMLSTTMSNPAASIGSSGY